ncbi:MAG: hypothetical protein JWO09_3289 [Bacteroidetes bacterium]|nr:hypothetical protein [Bacteroidota bacterium]
MRTYDHGFESSRGKARRKKKNSSLETIQRYIASLSEEQVSRMMEDSGKSYANGQDVTGRAIFENTKRHQQNNVQAKLEISQPEDQSEKQADKVAEGVTKGDVSISKMALEHTPSDINAKSEDAGMTTTPGFDQQLQGTKGQGSKLDTNVKSEMEGHLGTDLSGVNIHTGGEAQKMSGDINAKAFAHGQDVYFNEGQYNPSSQEGKGLLAHELTHTVQQKGDVGRKVQKMDDPVVLEARKKYKKYTLSNITQKLGDDYQQSKLEVLFFGEQDGPIPAWRSEIIKYYLIERGWEADKDLVPQWVEHKYVTDESGKEYLVVFTPIPGLRGREAAFGFIRWDLQLGPSKTFYRYQENKVDYDEVNDFATLEVHKKDKKNVIMGTTTKVEQLFPEGNYTPIEPKKAIVLAIELVNNFQNKNYVLDPRGKNGFIAHKQYIDLGILLTTDVPVELNKDPKKQEESRSGKFYVADEKDSKNGQTKIDKRTKEGLRKASSEEKKGSSGATFFIDETTLGFAKKKFIEGNSYSQKELTEEGIGANMLVKNFGKFKEQVGKAVFFIEIYGKINEKIKDKAQAAINSYRNTIIAAYKYPESPVNFGPADKLLEDSYALLYEIIYGEGGIFNKRADFAKNAIEKLRKDPNINYHYNLFKYCDEALANKKPIQPNSEKDGNPLTKVDLKPLAKVETAIGIMDIMSQAAMLGALRKSRIFLGNSGKYNDKFNDILLKISFLLYPGQANNEVEIQKLIAEGQNLIADPKYGEGLKVDIGLHNIQTELANAELQVVMIGAVVLSFIAGAGVGGFLTGLLEGALGGTALGATASAVILTTTEIVTGAVITTLVHQSLQAGLTDKKWGENFWSDFFVNLAMFGVGKLVEIAIVGRAAIPGGARLIGKGVWELIAEKGTTYYIEQESLIAGETAITTSAATENTLKSYSIINAEIPQTQNVLKAAGLDVNLVENGLKKVDPLTLEFFEKNPGKLTEATEKLSGELTSVKNSSPLAKVTETAKYLDEFAGLEKAAAGIKFNFKDLVVKYERHIFSKDHITKGIMDLGKNKEDILAEIDKLVMENITKLKEGDNFILKELNGHQTTIKTFIRNGEVTSIDAYKGYPTRLFGNVIR